MDETTNNRPAADQDSPLARRSFLKLTGSAAALLGAGGLAALMRPGAAYPAGAEKKIRLAVVGGNFGATFWWHEHPNCQVTGVTDLRPDRRERLRNAYKCDTVYDSLEEMAKKARNIDAVAIFSGAPDHARHVKLCMDRGWHVVSAVPACIKLEDAAAIEEIKERTGLKYMMAESSYYRQDCIFARNLFEKGGFGEMLYTELEYYHPDVNKTEHPERTGTRFREADGTTTWRYGYPPMLYPTHCLGFLVGVTRERIAKVSCLGWGDADSPVLKENVYKNPFWNGCALMQTSQGHISRCNVFWKIKAGGEQASWFGDKATLYMARAGVHGQIMTPGGRVKIPNYWDSEILPPPMRHESGHGGSAAFISAEFINALVEDREPAIDVYESLAMTVPGIVAHQSALKGGEQLSVPQFERAAG